MQLGSGAQRDWQGTAGSFSLLPAAKKSLAACVKQLETLQPHAEKRTAWLTASLASGEPSAQGAEKSRHCAQGSRKSERNTTDGRGK